MASTGEVWKLGHRPALDGLRGVAVVLVVIGHSGVPPFANAGAVGVDVFFALSGFLITSLLLEERAAAGCVSFVGFYRRRVLRLVPALVALVAGVWVLRFAFDLGPSWVSGRGTFAALFYSTNLISNLGPSLAHTWSLSLEEQFYLTWPALLLVLYRWGRHRAVFAGAMALGSASFVWIYVATWRPTVTPDTRSFYLLFGCALAAALSGGIGHVPPRWVVGPATVLLLLAAVSNGGVGSALALPAIALGSVLLIWVASTVGLPLLEGRALTWVGRRSYGIYLWHYPVMVLTFGASWPLRLAIIATFAFVAAILSWRYVESPFLAIKEKRRFVPRQLGHGAAVTTI